MSDNRRRERIRLDAAATRTKAVSLQGQVADPQGKTLLFTHILNTLNDVDNVFLADERVPRPDWWFAWAELLVRQASTELQDITKLIEQYGGPENVRTIK